jgi:dihydroorotate dehydrogenase
MSPKSSFISAAYQNIFRPVAFSLDAEFVHDKITNVGEFLENQKALLSWLFAYKNPSLSKHVLGVAFENPVGLAAGFDYDGHMAKVLKHVGFGFNTVGTVTAKPYYGNVKPRLTRLPASRALLVNKGFKSEGALKVAKRLGRKNLKKHTIGISVGSSNIPEVNTIRKAIEDYVFTFNTFKNKSYVKYFELNISCPNTAIAEPFTDPKNFKKLARAVNKLKIDKPIFVKMPNEITNTCSDTLVEIALKEGIKGFIFSNLVKDRKSSTLAKSEVKLAANLKGSISGKPTEKNAERLIAHTRKKFGESVAIIGVGGIFDSEDAIRKLEKGADLVQLITGMIYQGPQLVGQICEELGKDNV